LFEIKAREKFNRRHMVDIPRIKFFAQRRYRANWPFVDGNNKPISEDHTMDEFEDSTLEQTQSSVKERTAEPPMFRVILYNDDFTPRIFVVEILVTLFHKGVAEATELMWRVHHGKRGIAGVYPKEIAETKVAVATGLARENGFPLRLTLEPDL
jgi:ATP-dependent Clp protease adaptor protein ClpS